MADTLVGLQKKNALQERYYQGLLLLLFGLGAFLHLWSTPILEKPDESRHFYFAVHLSEGGSLPVQGKEVGLWGQQGSQPPLYYWVASLFMRSFDLSSAEALSLDNPHAATGRPDSRGNKHYYMAYLLAPDHPEWRGTIRALYVGRFLSLIAGLVTVWAVWDIAAALAPTRSRLPVALLAAGAVALWPQWQFIATSFSNDAWTVMWSTLVLRELALVTHAKDTLPLETLLPPQRALKIGLFVGAAALSKVSGAGLLGVVLPWLVWEGRRRGSDGWSRNVVAAVALVAGGAVLLAGWWYVRNVVLYGDPFGFTAMMRSGTMATREAPLSWPDIRSELIGLRISFLALFGWFNLFVDKLAYVLWDLALLLGVLGAVWQGWRGRRTADGGIGGWLLLWLFLMILALVRWTLIIPASQGRLLFPAIGAIFPLLALGWLAWVPHRYHHPAVVLFLLLMGLWSFSLPFRFIVPAYQPAQLLEQLPPSAVAKEINFDNKVLLAGVTTSPQWVVPGSTYDLTLYWRSLGSMRERYSVSVKLFGPEGRLLAQHDSYPDGGRWPTTQWPGNGLIEDSRQLTIPESVATPLEARLVVEVFRYRDLVPLQAVEAQASTVQVANVAIRDRGYEPRPNSGFAFRPEVQKVKLADRSVAVDFVWKVGKPLIDNYQVFFHLAPAVGQPPIKQADFEPLGGHFPTRHWLPGDRWKDQARLELPAAGEIARGEYYLLLGLYNLKSQQAVEGEAGRKVWSVAHLRFDGSQWYVE